MGQKALVSPRADSFSHQSVHQVKRKIEQLGGIGVDSETFVEDVVGREAAHEELALGFRIDGREIPHDNEVAAKVHLQRARLRFLREEEKHVRNRPVQPGE